MKLTYNDAAIDALVDMTLARTTDACGGMFDSLCVRLREAGDWFAWQPNQDDRMTLSHGGYTTGTMYVDSGRSTENGYELYARSCPTAGDKKWACYEKVNLAQLAGMAAKELGVALALYGTDGAQTYERLVRRNEGWPAFLNRIAERESMMLKFSAGKLMLIDWAWVCAQDAAMHMDITANQQGVRYTQANNEYKTLTVAGLPGKATATDANAYGSRSRTEAEPVFDTLQAGRWARGLLLKHNLETEKIDMDLTLTPSLAAVMKIELGGLSVLSGDWLTTKVTHDFVKETTTLSLCRCRTGIL